MSIGIIAKKRSSLTRADEIIVYAMLKDPLNEIPKAIKDLNNHKLDLLKQYLEQGIPTDLAMTDPSLFASLMDGVKKLYLGGFARLIERKYEY
tara:strand:- start:163 stop:441 length:279 start_codon:yes stop_codon:yes gene_type:complete